MTSILDAYYATIPVSKPALPPSFVQGTSDYIAGSTSTHSLAFASNVALGDLIVVAVGIGNAGGASAAIADSRSNVYTSSNGGAPVVVSGAPMTIQVFWAWANATGSLTITITSTGGSGTSSFNRLLIHEYSPFTAYDSESILAPYAGGTPSKTITTTHPNDLVFAWCLDAAGTVTFLSPLANRLSTPGGESTGDCLNIGPAGTYTVAATTAGGPGSMIIESFSL